MRAGRLDTRIRIERSTTDRDDHGGVTQSWALLFEVWAQIAPLRGRELIAAAQTMPEAHTKFVIRYRAGITEADRIVYDSKNYDIIHIAELGRDVGLEILAKLP